MSEDEQASIKVAFGSWHSVPHSPNLALSLALPVINMIHT